MSRVTSVMGSPRSYVDRGNRSVIPTSAHAETLRPTHAVRRGARPLLVAVDVERLDRVCQFEDASYRGFRADDAEPTSVLLAFRGRAQENADAGRIAIRQI